MKGESMTTAAVKKRLRSKEAECIFHELLIADAAISPEMEEMARAAVRSAVAKYESTRTRRQGILYERPRQFRLAVVGLVLLIFVGYFTIMPAGRTMAQKLFNMVFVRDGNSYEIVNQNEIEGEPGTLAMKEDIKRDYDSYAELERNTGLTPAYFEADWLTFTYIHYYKSKFHGGDTVWCFFETEDGTLASVRQEWGDLPSITIGSNGEYFTEDYGTGHEWHCWVDVIDGSFSAIAILDNSILTITAQEGIAPKEIMAALVIRQ